MLPRTLTISAALIAAAALLTPQIGYGGEPSATATDVSSPSEGLDPAAVAKRYHGSFHYAGGARGQARAYEAVEDVTAELNDLLRPMARKFLHDAATAPAVFRVDISPSIIALGPRGKKLLAAPANGAPKRWMGPDGGIYNVVRKIENGVLTERITGLTNGSSTRKTYTLSDDGARLTIRVTIKHKMLPKTLTYRHVYRRA